MFTENTDKFEQPSRSAKKRAITAIEDLTREILELSASDLAKLSLDDELLQHIAETKKIKTHVAKRRRLRFMCRIIQAGDVAAIESSMLKLKHRGRQ